LSELPSGYFTTFIIDDAASWCLLYTNVCTRFSVTKSASVFSFFWKLPTNSMFCVNSVFCTKLQLLRDYICIGSNSLTYDLCSTPFFCWMLWPFYRLNGHFDWIISFGLKHFLLLAWERIVCIRKVLSGMFTSLGGHCLASKSACSCAKFSKNKLLPGFLDTRVNFSLILFHSFKSWFLVNNILSLDLF
jgi:hypothetical protein